MKVLLQSLRSVCLRIENRLTAQIVRLQGSLDAVRDAAHAALTYAVSAQRAADSKMGRINPVGYGSFSMERKAGTTVGGYSHAEGFYATASGNYSHAEGYNTTASGDYSHAEGYYTTVNGKYSHAEGIHTAARGDYSHAEGFRASASGDYSHAEGNSGVAAGDASHKEGAYNTASGDYSHAEGYDTNAAGDASHTEGYYTTAARRSQHAEGEYNIAESDAKDQRGEYVHIVGNGTSYSARSNAHTLDWEGNAWFAGDVYVGSTSGTNRDDGSKKLATEDSIPTALPNPHKLTLTGAVEAEYDGSAAVSVEIPAGGGGDSSLGITGASVGQTVKITEVDDNGRPTAWEAVEMAGAKSWRKIADITLEEDATELLVDTDEAGNALSLQALSVRFVLTGREDTINGNYWAYMGETDNVYRTIAATSGSATNIRSMQGLAYFFPGSMWGMWNAAAIGTNLGAPISPCGTRFYIVSKTEGFFFPAGSRLVVYGIDA